MYYHHFGCTGQKEDNHMTTDAERLKQVREEIAGELSKEVHCGTVIKQFLPSEWELYLQRADAILAIKGLEVTSEEPCFERTVHINYHSKDYCDGFLVGWDAAEKAGWVRVIKPEVKKND